MSVRVFVDQEDRLVLALGESWRAYRASADERVLLLGDWGTYAGEYATGRDRSDQFGVLFAVAAWFAKAAPKGADATAVLVGPDDIYDLPTFENVAKKRETDPDGARKSLRATVRSLVGSSNEPCSLFVVDPRRGFRLKNPSLVRLHDRVYDWLWPKGSLETSRLPVQPETESAISEKLRGLAALCTKTFCAAGEPPRFWYVALADLCGGITLRSSGGFPLYIDDEHAREVDEELEGALARIVEWTPCGCFVGIASKSGRQCAGCGRDLCAACANSAQGGGCSGCARALCTACRGLCRERHGLAGCRAPARCDVCGRVACVDCLRRVGPRTTSSVPEREVSGSEWPSRSPGPSPSEPKKRSESSRRVEIVCAKCAHQKDVAAEFVEVPNETVDPLNELLRALAVRANANDPATDEELIRERCLPWCIEGPWVPPSDGGDPSEASTDGPSDDEDDDEGKGEDGLQWNRSHGSHQALGLRAAAWVLEQLGREERIAARSVSSRACLVFVPHLQPA